MGGADTERRRFSGTAEWSKPILTPWLGRRDSNPQYQSQSLVCYRYTTSHRMEKGLGLLPIPFYHGVGKGTRTLDTRNHNPVL